MCQSSRNCEVQRSSSRDLSIFTEEETEALGGGLAVPKLHSKSAAAVHMEPRDWIPSSLYQPQYIPS